MQYKVQGVRSLLCAENSLQILEDVSNTELIHAWYANWFARLLGSLVHTSPLHLSASWRYGDSTYCWESGRVARVSMSIIPLCTTRLRKLTQLHPLPCFLSCIWFLWVHPLFTTLTVLVRCRPLVRRFHQSRSSVPWNKRSTLNYFIL